MRKSAFFFMLSFLIWNGTRAQQSSRIMDASIEWFVQSSQYNGLLHLFLTDVNDVTGVSISIGSAPELSDIYNVQYTYGPGGNFTGTWSATLSDLQVDIGTYNYHAHYYTKITLLLQNSETREITIHSSN